MLELTLIHLDSHYWSSGWEAKNKADWLDLLRSLTDGDQWIMDGHYSGSLKIRMARADAIVYLDLGFWPCLMRVIKRNLQWRGRTRPSLAEGCPEKISLSFYIYILRFHLHKRGFIIRMLKEEWKDRTLVVLNNREAIDNYINSLQRKMKLQ